MDCAKIKMSTKSNFCVILPVLIILISHCQIFSQPQYEYKERDNNREEGIKSIEVSATDLEVLSFTAYREDVEPSAKVNLKIKFYVYSDTTLYITAKELIPRKFYLMKPIKTKWDQGWQEFSSWPTDAVINPLGIRFEQIGIIGRLFHDRAGSGHIAPLIIYHTKHPARIAKYTIHLKPKETLSRVSYRLLRAGSRDVLKKETLRKRFYSREPFTISIDLADLEPGEYRLLLKCRIKNKTYGPVRTYNFYHNPNL